MASTRWIAALFLLAAPACTGDVGGGSDDDAAVDGTLGATDSAPGAVDATSASDAPGQGPDAPPPLGTLLFFDDFEYAVGREDANAASLFQDSGGWTWAKTMQSYGSGNGYLYTVTGIAGFSGAFPGLGSGRVLAMEGLPDTLGSQTDFYLQLGHPEEASSDEAIPGDVWFQFWIYINHHGDQLSHIDGRDKFIYPCNAAYPCHSGKWLFMIGSGTYNPVNEAPYGVPSNGEAFLIERDNQVGEVAYDLVDEVDQSKLGQFDTSEYLAPNRWTLVKTHIDTSTVSGSWEAWLRPAGGNWTKVVEWIDGETPHFRWTIPAAEVGGHRALRMPTTIPGNAAAGNDVWIYMDDFAMADSEDALPTY